MVAITVNNTKTETICFLHLIRNSSEYFGDISVFASKLKNFEILSRSKTCKYPRRSEAIDIEQNKIFDEILEVIESDRDPITSKFMEAFRITELFTTATMNRKEANILTELNIKIVLKTSNSLLRTFIEKIPKNV